jgi:hypothetical protein
MGQTPILKWRIDQLYDQAFKETNDQKRFILYPKNG